MQFVLWTDAGRKWGKNPAALHVNNLRSNNVRLNIKSKIANYIRCAKTQCISVLIDNSHVQGRI